MFAGSQRIRLGMTSTHHPSDLVSLWGSNQTGMRNGMTRKKAIHFLFAGIQAKPVERPISIIRMVSLRVRIQPKSLLHFQLRFFPPPKWPGSPLVQTFISRSQPAARLGAEALPLEWLASFRRPPFSDTAARGVLGRVGLPSGVRASEHPLRFKGMFKGVKLQTLLGSYLPGV